VVEHLPSKTLDSIPALEEQKNGNFSHLRSTLQLYICSLFYTK
jgi:hypothetical protein